MREIKFRGKDSKTGKWFDLIKSGDKWEEYREIKPYWISRLMYIPSYNECVFTDIADVLLNTDSCDLERRLDEYESWIKRFDIVRFRRAYTSTTMDFKIKEITVGRGYEEMGAPTDRNVFIIKF